MRRIRILVLASLLLGGCFTGRNLFSPEVPGNVPRGAIYGGLRTGIADWRAHPEDWILVLLDMPFSLVLDTILLPVTIPYELWFSGGSPPAGSSSP